METIASLKLLVTHSNMALKDTFWNDVTSLTNGILTPKKLTIVILMLSFPYEKHDLYILFNVYVCPL